MKPERWEQIEQLYHAALERAPDARAAFLNEACAGDEELRHEVAALVAYDDRESRFIEAPALELAAKAFAAHPQSEARVELRATPDRTATATDEVEAADLLCAGQVIRDFRILRKLGQGGMGEVYQAEDQKLGRQVALKFLPAGTALDQSARQRFLREARAASALNHPNIVIIHAIEEAAGLHFIVMEYVEGETLKARIERGPLEFARARDLGSQVAAALAAAHAIGIIHRDIKPANIVITPPGQAKVLDFGLAKRVQTLAGALHKPDAAPLSELTSAGIIVGTVAYMSPEQTRGEELDARSDIFSLGCVLYEAATGQRPFNGPSTLAVMHEVATLEPPCPSTLKPDLPRAFDAIIQRALAKEKHQRYASAKELAEALRNLPVSAAGPQRRTIRPARKLAVCALVAVVALAGLAWGWRWLRGALTVKRFQSFSTQTLPNTENSWLVALSPDGEYMAHAVNTRSVNAPDEQSLWLRQIATSSDVQLAAPAQVHYNHLAFAPDGRHVYFSRANRAPMSGAEGGGYHIYKIPVLGGADVKLVAETDGLFTLAPDSKRLAFVRSNREESRLLLARADGSAEQVLVRRRQPNTFTHLAWSPDGRVIACAATDVDADGKWVRVKEVKVSDGTERLLAAEKWRNIHGLAWLPDGSTLLMARLWLWRIAYPDGKADRIPGDNNYYTEVSLSANGGVLASIATILSGNIWVITNEDAAQARPITADSAPIAPRWTPDGGIVFQSSRSGNVEIWSMRADGAGLKQLTVNLALDGDPVCSPDGRYVVFTSDRSGTTNLWRMDADGGNPRQLTSGKFDARPEISPDGQWVLYTATEPEEMSLWKVPIAGGTAVSLARVSRPRPAISPDGKLIASGYGDQQSNAAAQVALIPFAGGAPVRVLDLPGSANSILRWTADGRGLAYLNTLGSVRNLWLQPLEGGTAKPVTDFKDYGVQSFDWSRDGKSLLCARTVKISKVVLLKDVR